MGALLNVVLVCCVSSLLSLSVTGTAGTGLYLVGTEEKTKELEQEMLDEYTRGLDVELEEELSLFSDPRSTSFTTRKESSPGFGQLPYFPSGAYFRRRPIESSLTWPYRGSTLPDKGRDSYTLMGSPVKAVDNINENPDTIKWQQNKEGAWTDLFDKDTLKVDCGNDAINSFQVRSEKSSLTRNIVTEKEDEQTGTTRNVRSQFKSYHDNYKQLYKCLTGSKGWDWDPESGNRVRVPGTFAESITLEKTEVLDAVDLNKDSHTQSMACDFESGGEMVFDENSAGKEFPISMIEPIWDNSLTFKEFSINGKAGDTLNPKTNDYKPAPQGVGFKYRCLKKPVIGPCKEMKYTDWVPFLASQGEGIRELKQSMHSGFTLPNFKATDEANFEPNASLKALSNDNVDPVVGLGRVKCHPTEVLTRVDFEVSKGLDAPKDWIRWKYRCCKM
jgi:hypothetical protein